MSSEDWGALGIAIVIMWPAVRFAENLIVPLWQQHRERVKSQVKATRPRSRIGQVLWVCALAVLAVAVIVAFTGMVIIGIGLAFVFTIIAMIWVF